MKYLPFLNGIYSTAPGLIPVAKEEMEADKFIFQIDDSYNTYLENKKHCRTENLQKYYLEENAQAATTHRVNKYIVQQLQKNILIILITLKPVTIVF